MSKDKDRARVWVSINLLNEIQMKYPDCSSAANALELFIIHNLENQEALDAQGENNEPAKAENPEV